MGEHHISVLTHLEASSCCWCGTSHHIVSLYKYLVLCWTRFPLPWNRSTCHLMMDGGSCLSKICVFSAAVHEEKQAQKEKQKRWLTEKTCVDMNQPAERQALQKQGITPWRGSWYTQRRLFGFQNPSTQCLFFFSFMKLTRTVREKGKNNISYSSPSFLLLLHFVGEEIRRRSSNLQ